MMSFAKITAGTGYLYLVRHTALGDADPASKHDAATYYAAQGNPPGHWTGRGAPLPGLERQERNRDVGLKGELMVVEHERAWLSEHGRSDLAERVAHIPSTLGDGAGYDVASFLLDGAPHHSRSAKHLTMLQ